MDLTDPNGEGGSIGGADVLALGFLTFVVGGLLIANAWGVVDAKLAVTAAAREAVRAYVEADDAGSAEAAALAAARSTLDGHGRDGGRIDPFLLSGRFVRCARVTAEVGYRVPAVSLPWLGGLGDTTVVGRHSEVVDPFRAGLAAQDPAAQEPDCA